MSQVKVLPTVILLAPLVFSFAFAMDIYIPAVPAMKEVLHTSQANIQLTLSIFMLVSGLGQLILGPAADQFGRRKLILCCIFLFIFGSLGCALANSIETLILARVFQALGGCGMMVGAFAIVRDLFAGNEAATVYSFLNCGVGMSPLFAPIIGSYLVEWFNWRAGFIFLTIMGLLILVSTLFKIKETLSPKNILKIDHKIFLRYWKILTNGTFITYSLCASAGLIYFFVFFSSSPYIIINLLHVPVKNFGYYFFIVGATFFLGSLLSGKISEKAGIFNTVLLGTILMLIAGLMMWAWYAMAGVGTLQFLLPSMLAAVGGSFMMGSGLGGAMQPFAEVAGSAAALAGCLEFLSSAIFGSMIMSRPVHSTNPLSFSMIVFSFLSLVAMICYHRFYPHSLDKTDFK